MLDYNINSKLVDIDQNCLHKDYWNISWSLGEELFDLIKLHEPKRVLEVGTSNGFSGLWILKGLKDDSKLVTIEVDNSRFLEAKKNFEKCFVKDKVEQIQGEVFDILDKKELTGKFDFIFMDAAQSKYLDLIKRIEELDLIDEEFTIVCDNVISHKNMKEFLEYMKLNYDSSVIEKDSGFLVAKKKRFNYE